MLDLLSSYGLLGRKPSVVPMEQNLKLNDIVIEKNALLIHPVEYKKLVGKLIYIIITRPDISLVVHTLSQSMHSPNVSHLKVAFRVLRYLKGCLGLGMKFKCVQVLSLRAYCDSDWASCSITRKLATGFCILVDSNLVSYKSKKQFTISRSLVEAEYRAVVQTCCEII